MTPKNGRADINLPLHYIIMTLILRSLSRSRDLKLEATSHQRDGEPVDRNKKSN